MRVTCLKEALDRPASTAVPPVQTCFSAPRFAVGKLHAIEFDCTVIFRLDHTGYVTVAVNLMALPRARRYR